MKKLRSIQLNITNTCAQRCEMCRKYEWPRDVLPVGDLLAVVEALDPATTVILSGGDPLMHPQIDEILSALRGRGLHWAILTNGLVYNDDLDGCSYINLSLDGATRETYRRVRGVDTFERVMGNIERYVGRYPNVPIMLDSTISTLNMNELPDLLRIASQLKVEINFQTVHTFDDLMPTNEDWKRILPMATQVQAELRPKSNLFIFMNSIFNGYPTSERCSAIDSHCVVDSDGSVFPCCRALNDNGAYENRASEWVSGNIRTGKIEDAWNNAQTSSLLDPLRSKCGSFCSQCDRYVMFNSFKERYMDAEVLFL